MALIDKASLLMVPSVYEDGTLYNVLPSGNKAPDETGNHNGYDQTRADFTFSRGFNLTATRVNADGLIEKGRENLLLQSNQFDTTWLIGGGGSGLTLTGGQADKDGGNTAWLIDEVTNDQAIYQVVSTNGIQTFSIYAKAGTNEWMRLGLGGGAFSHAYFDLVNGVLGNTLNVVDSSIEDAGNGWWRCSVTANKSVNAVYVYPSEANNSAGTNGSIYIQSAQLESGLVATPYIETGATTATAGVLENTPRIDYSSGAGALLLESQRTNLIPQSEYFGAWTLNGGGTGSNPILDFGYTSPEGVDNAYKVTFDTGAGTTTSDESIMYIGKSGLTAGNDYTASVYLKGAVGGEEVIVRDTEGSYTKWTLTTEWKRYEMTQAAAGSSYATSFGVRQGLAGIGTINSNAIVYMYAFQSEAGSHVSSYVPTYGSAATRGADSCSVTGVSDVIGQTEGTLFVDVDITLTGITNRMIAVNDGTAFGNINMLSFSPLNRFQFEASPINILSSTYPAGRYKVAVVYSAAGGAMWVNGVEVATTTTTTTTTNYSKLFVGDSPYGVGQKKGTKQALVFPTRLTNEELATLTTL